jgi:hypothetical protein
MRKIATILLNSVAQWLLKPTILKVLLLLGYDLVLRHTLLILMVWIILGELLLYYLWHRVHLRIHYRRLDKLRLRVMVHYLHIKWMRNN